MFGCIRNILDVRDVREHENYNYQSKYLSKNAYDFGFSLALSGKSCICPSRNPVYLNAFLMGYRDAKKSVDSQ